MIDITGIDPLTKQRFMWQALTDVADKAGGVNPNDKDAVIVWCTNTGLLYEHPTQRGQVVLTQAGINLLWSYAQHAQKFLSGGRRGA